MRFNLMAPINQSTSYGLVGTNVAYALDKLGHSVSLFPIGGEEFEREKESVLRRLTGNQDDYNDGAACVRIFHQNRLAEHVGHGTRVGFPIFELDKFNKVELYNLANQHKIFVCSDWAKQIVEDRQMYDNVGVFVVPLGVDRAVFNENVKREPPEDYITRFLSVGKHEVRKGHDILHHAFRAAFSPSDNVQLWMSSYNPFIGDMNYRWEEEYEKVLDRQYRKVGRVKTNQEMASLYQYCDAVVLPSRAEGWMMPGLEALSMGKPLITTNVSAQTQYVSPLNSLLIECPEKEVADDGLWFRPEKTDGGRWAKFGDDQFEQLVNHMRAIHIKKQNGNLELNTEGIKTAKSFSWENTAEKLVEALS